MRPDATPATAHASGSGSTDGTSLVSTAHEVRLESVAAETIDDPQLLVVLERAERLSTPKPLWYLTLAHNPQMAIGFADFWELTHRGGRIDHQIKELMRIAISTLLGCEFCADQRSVLAVEAGLDEDVAAACAAPDFNHPDARTRAALRFARAMVLDAPATPADWDPVYAEMRSVFSPAEIVELGCFAAIALGGVKLSRSLNTADSAT